MNQSSKIRPVPEGTKTIGDVTVPEPVFSCRDVDVFYGDKHAIKKVNIDIGRKQVLDRKSTRLNSSHVSESRMPSSA